MVAREAFAETMWPTRCIGCGLPGTLLCADCVADLPLIDRHLACPRCGAPHGHLLCTECPIPGSENFEALPFSAARASTSYQDVAQRMMMAYKDADEVRLDAAIATCICQAIRGKSIANPKRPAALVSPETLESLTEDWTGWADALVGIPATSEALRRRGFDHIDRIVALCSRWTNLPLLRPLRSLQSTDQRHLSRNQRASNRTDSFIPINEDATVPPHILLVDDVLTTGATTGTAAQALLGLGATEVRVAVFARVW